MLEPSDMEIITDAVYEVVNRVVGARMEEVYAVLEELRGGFTNTVEVLNGNDNALLGEIRKVQHASPAEVLEMAGESWERFIRNEAEAIGMTVVKDLGDYRIIDTSKVSAPPHDEVAYTTATKVVKKG